MGPTGSDACTAHDGRTEYTTQDVRGWLAGRRKWGRWGDDDERGAFNLITPEKRLAAAAAIREGIAISLSRPVTARPALDAPRPVTHHVRTETRGRADEGWGGGSAREYIGIDFHGQSITHLDALSHVWSNEGMWNGRDGWEMVRADGARWASIDRWADGFFTRAILIDVPRHRGTDYVTRQEPIHGNELAEIVDSLDVRPEPGDAIVIHGGRDAWSREHHPWGAKRDHLPANMGALVQDRPGLHASCLPILADWDPSLIVWDMMDATPTGFEVPFTLHAVLFEYGIGLLDNADLARLVEKCRRTSRTEFALVANPLVIVGGTGSPINPVALL